MSSECNSSVSPNTPKNALSLAVISLLLVASIVGFGVWYLLTTDCDVIVAYPKPITRFAVDIESVTIESSMSTTVDPTQRSEEQDNLTRDSDSLTEKREKVKEMMLHAWNSYRRFAWGFNELRPLSRRPHGGVFGQVQLGATIVDSLDTLFVMELYGEFAEGRHWIASNFTLDNVYADVSVFETTTRFIGGLLAAYALTGDHMFADKAAHVADKLLPAFQTPTGIPMAIINLRNAESKTHPWLSGGCCILSEIGGLHLEFVYLSEVTGNPVYRELVRSVRQTLHDLVKARGLYSNYLNPTTGSWGLRHVSLGAGGDGFYEYMLKSWIQSGGQDEQARRMYDEAMGAVCKHMLRVSQNGLMYVSDVEFNQLEHRMDHLACFAGGMFALGAYTKPSNQSDEYMSIGAALTNTCHETYIRAATHLGPEAFHFHRDLSASLFSRPPAHSEAKAVKRQEKKFTLHSETVESYFIMWRLTHDQKYRDWGWDVVLALELFCRTPDGFAGLSNVYLDLPAKEDVQPSYFLAETLKYLYLLFSDDSVLPLEKWTFNTAAHPLPILHISV